MTAPELRPPEERVVPPLAVRVARPIAAATRAVHWRAAVREFVVILAGVLGALAAQAWWQGREERGREHDYLRQLLADTRENERRLDRAIAEDSVSERDVARLAGALYGAGALPPSDTLLSWFGGGAFSASDLQPLTGSYSALVASGDLRLIQTDSLRAQLVAYVARLDSEREKLQFFFAQAFADPGRVARTLPFMRSAFVAHGQRVAPRRGRDAVDFARLRHDPELASIMFSIQVANRNRIAHLQGMRAETRRLRRALEAEGSLGASERAAAAR